MTHTDETKFPGGEKYPIWLGLVAGGCGLPLFVVFAVLGQPMRGWVAGLSAAVITCLTFVLWDLRNHVSFWAVMTLNVAAHCFIVYKSNWPDNHLPGMIALPFVILDFAFWLYATVTVVRRFGT